MLAWCSRIITVLNHDRHINSAYDAYEFIIYDNAAATFFMTFIMRKIQAQVVYFVYTFFFVSAEINRVSSTKPPATTTSSTKSPGPSAPAKEEPARSQTDDHTNKHRRRKDIVWRNVILLTFIHMCSLYAFVNIYRGKVLTIVWRRYMFWLLLHYIGDVFETFKIFFKSTII